MNNGPYRASDPKNPPAPTRPPGVERWSLGERPGVPAIIPIASLVVGALSAFLLDLRYVVMGWVPDGVEIRLLHVFLFSALVFVPSLSYRKDEDTSRPYPVKKGWGVQVGKGAMPFPIGASLCNLVGALVFYVFGEYTIALRSATAAGVIFFVTFFTTLEFLRYTPEPTNP